ncbi:MAG: orotate phosphoribosyltransferase [candidate division WOR-3 bacterium]
MDGELGRILEQSGVMREGHFLLTSGRHSDRYFEKFRILERPQLCELFAARIAERFRPAAVTAVCGPTTGGTIIAYEVARQLGMRCVIAEKAETGRRIGRGFKLTGEDRVLVVDDVLTTGGSIADTLAAVRQTGAQVAGVGVFIDRSSGVEFEEPFFAAYRQEVRTWDASECPLCRSGVPLEAPGRGDKRVSAAG